MHARTKLALRPDSGILAIDLQRLQGEVPQAHGDYVNNKVEHVGGGDLGDAEPVALFGRAIRDAHDQKVAPHGEQPQLRRRVQLAGQRHRQHQAVVLLLGCGRLERTVHLRAGAQCFLLQNLIDSDLRLSQADKKKRSKKARKIKSKENLAFHLKIPQFKIRLLIDLGLTLVAEGLGAVRGAKRQEREGRRRGPYPYPQEMREETEREGGRAGGRAGET